MASYAPLVSVIMGSYNARTFMDATLQSILSQDYAPLELVIVDDRSRDGTWEKLQSLKDPRLRLFRNDKNRGIAFTRNKGFCLSRGRYITFFDHDDMMLRGAIRKRVAFLEKHPEAMMVSGYTREVIDQYGSALSEKELPDRWYAEEAAHSLLRRYRRIDARLYPKFYCLVSLLSNLLARRRFLEKIGTFDERFTFSSEVDYLARAVRRHPIHFIDVPIKAYRVHGTNRSFHFSETSRIAGLREAKEIQRRYVNVAIQ